MTKVVQPFRIEVPDAMLADLRERLARTRFPDQIDGANWDYGTELSYLRELVAYWKDAFDWRAQERLLNAFPHFETGIDDHRVHFIGRQGLQGRTDIGHGHQIEVGVMGAQQFVGRVVFHHGDFQPV